MRKRLVIALLAGLVLELGLPRTTQAFWPLDRGRISVVSDTLTTEGVQKRFETWKKGSMESVAPDTASVVAGDAKAASGASASAAAQDTTNAGTVEPDSIVAGSTAAPDDSVGAEPAAGSDNAAGSDKTTRIPPGAGFVPLLTVGLTSSNDAMNLSSNLKTSFADVSGVTLSTNVSYGENIRLTQKTNAKSRSITNSFLLPLAQYGLKLQLETRNDRQDLVGARTVRNASTSNNSENRTGAVQATLSRDLAALPVLSRSGIAANILEGFSANTSYSRRFNRNDQSISATQGAASGQREHEDTGNTYGLGMGFDRWKWMTVKARVGRARFNNLDRSPSLSSDENPTGEARSGSESDSARVDVTLPTVWRTTNLRFGFQVTNGLRSFTDAVRSASGSTTGTVGEFALERERSYRRSFDMGATVQPTSRIDLGFSFSVGRDSVSYDIRPNQFKDSQTQKWTLDSVFRYTTTSMLTVKYESSQNDINRDEALNPENSLTRVDEHRKLYTELNHFFTKTFSLKAHGEIQLQQGFYEHEGPQGKGDRDDLRTKFGVDLGGTISPGATGSVTAYVRTFDQAFIDPRRAGNSKNETEYVVRPSFSYTINDRAHVRQSYGLSSKVLDDVFNPVRSTLNRNHFMTTSLTYSMTSKLDLTATYDYLLQDSGSFVATVPGGPRFFSPTVRTKKDGISIGASYALLADGKLTFVSQQTSNRERRFRFTDGIAGPPTITELGNLAMGVDSKLELGTLKLVCGLRRNQSFNVSLNRRVFYNTNASLSYTF